MALSPEPGCAAFGPENEYRQLSSPCDRYSARNTDFSPGARRARANTCAPANVNGSTLSPTRNCTLSYTACCAGSRKAIANSSSLDLGFWNVYDPSKSTLYVLNHNSPFCR